MKFLLITLITHLPDPVSGEKKSPAGRLRDVLDKAVLAEELGFDGFAVGERHEDPFISSSPPVVLSNIAARTSKIGLFTGVTTLSLLDPVRAFEDYSTLDNLSDGRLELIIGKGNGAAQAELFHVTTADQWDRNREGYELFRLLWENEQVTWSGRFRPPLVNAKTFPGRCRAEFESGTAAQRVGIPSISPLATVTRSSPPTSATPSSPTPSWFVTTGNAGSSTATDPKTRWSAQEPPGSTSLRRRRKQLAAYAPTIEARLAAQRRAGIPVVFESVEDFVERELGLGRQSPASDRQGGSLPRAARARSDSPERRRRRRDDQPTAS